MHGNNKRTYTRTCQESMTNMLKRINSFLLLLWIATFSIMGVLVLLDAEMSAVVSFCRILVPPLLIAIICHYEWISYPKRFLTRASDQTRFDFAISHMLYELASAIFAN